MPDEQKAVTATEIGLLLAEQAKQNQANMMEMVKELKKPTEAEQRKLDKESSDARAKAKAARIAAEAEEQRKQMLRDNCSHERPDGQHLWVAHVNADSCWRAMCQGCRTVMPPVVAAAEQAQQGVNLGAYHKGGRYMLEQIEQLHKTTMPNCQDTACYIHRKKAVA